MSDSDPELRRRLEALADRGAPKGAIPVLAGARAQAGSAAFARRPALTVLAVAACLALIVTTATVISRNASDSGRPLQSAVGSSTTTPDAGGVSALQTPSDPAVTAPAATTPTTPTTAGKPAVTPTTRGTSRTTVPLTNEQARTRLAAFTSCPQLVDFAKTEALRVVGPYGLPGVVTWAASGGVAASPAFATDQMGSPREAQKTLDFSETNNQEAGVDEPDTVKTDGRRVFAIANNKVWATSVEGAPRVVGSMSFDNLSPSQLLLVGDRLLVVGWATSAPSGDQSSGSKMIAPGGPAQSRVAVVDVRNAAAMKVVSTLTLDGSYLSARLVKGVARVVLRSEPARFTWAYPQSDTPQARQEATDKNRATVAASTTANWVPSLTVTDGAGRTSPPRPLSDCDDSLHPQAFSGFGMLTVLTLDPTKPEAPQSTSVMAGGNIVYASSTGLYVSTTAWDRIENQQFVRFSGETAVHKFDISSAAGASYRGSGRVKGVALNQYSLSELHGRLRIATTGNTPESTESYVTVLEDNGAALVQVGQVGGLGKGERIYAVRFMGETAYVVTFRQTDPLYTIDLSDPTKPRVAGELKITGFSAYLHPIGDDLLLGIGQDANEQGRTTGVQASVFDVSDPANPKLLQRQNFGQGNSSAAFDPHAFLWWPATKLAVLPTVLYGSNGPTFSGAIGITASTAGMSEVGRVKHPETTQNNYKYSPMIERSLVIGDSLYTMSQAGLLSSDLKTLGDRAWVPFA